MIWCVEDDPSIRELETYVLNSTGLEYRLHSGNPDCRYAYSYAAAEVG